MQKWKLKINCSKTETVVFNGKVKSPTIGTEKIKICDSSKSLGVIVDKKLSFANHSANYARTLNAKMNMLKPFIYNGLHCSSALRIPTQVMLPKALYAVSVWNSKDCVLLHKHLQNITGAHYNPSSDCLHKLSGVLTVKLMMTGERLQTVRNLMSAGLTRIITSPQKSALAKIFLADCRKLIPRSTKLEDCAPTALSQKNIKSLISREWERQWKASLQNRQCHQGLLSELPPKHLSMYSLPLHNRHQILGKLCDLLTGHSKLQLFQYIIKNSYTLTCSCLEEDESPSHYLFRCKDYATLRDEIKPNPQDWDSNIEFITKSRRL